MTCNDAMTNAASYPRGIKVTSRDGMQVFNGPQAEPGDHWVLSSGDGTWAVEIISAFFDQYGQWSYRAKFPGNGAIGTVQGFSLKRRIK